MRPSVTRTGTKQPKGLGREGLSEAVVVRSYRLQLDLRGTAPRYASEELWLTSKPNHPHDLKMVEPVGIEPTTSSLQSLRSPS